VAVVDKYRELSYEELNRRANQLAHYLKKLGVGPDVVVGLCMEPSAEMVIGVLGVLKAGGAYVPLDMEYPAERLAYMMRDAQLNFLLTQERLRDTFAGFTGHLICIDTHNLEKVLQENDANLDGSVVDPENLAYVLYTSGSTGRPKGVGMTQRPLCNLVRWQLMSSPGPKRTLQFSPLTFDLSFYAIFATLCSGGFLVLIDNDTRRDPVELWKVVCEREIEKLFLPFIALQGLAETACAAEWESTSLREVITTAEQLKVTPALRRFFDRLSIAMLDNEYGPTETHVVTAHRLQANSKEWPLLPPIGKPIANDQVYVLDANYTPLPIGVPGGLYLAGVGLARGYLNRPDLTAERFLPNSFSVSGGERMYLTGDLARWLPDGNLEFLGRMDHQVKIRGFRIELGEIEAALQEHGGVRQAVVIAREDQVGEKHLVAYVVPEQEHEKRDNGSGRAELLIGELREHLLGKLPEYMMPSAYVQLEKLPLNHNGKVDRKNLPQADTATPEQEYVGPRSATEETLCRLWQEVLRRERVGIHDNFFKSGGHSLLAARVAARMRESFQIDVPLRRIFESPTVAQLAEVIDQIKQSNGASGANGASSQRRPAIKRVVRKAVLVDVD
jgi:amino acid adenylation domain-containing protein